MPLWLLKRNECDWDETRGFVVRAPDEVTARRVAQVRAARETVREEWMDGNSSTCTPIMVDGPDEVVLRDFMAG